MKILVPFCIGLFILSCSPIKKTEAIALELSRSIVKIQALAVSGKQSMGSGVVVAPNIIATNCHVTRKATRVSLIEEVRIYPILAQTTVPEFDVCLLKTESLTLPTAEIAEDEAVNIGDDIIIFGYPYALSLRTMRGKVIGLHPYAKHQIIEINAGFNHGASGGGVFNSSGKLIGLMTFMGQEDGEMHFYVIPASWLAMGLEKDFYPLKPLTARSFWEKGKFIKQKLLKE